MAGIIEIVKGWDEPIQFVFLCLLVALASGTIELFIRFLSGFTRKRRQDDEPSESQREN